MPKYLAYSSGIAHQLRHVADVFLCNLGLIYFYSRLSEVGSAMSDFLSPLSDVGSAMSDFHPPLNEIGSPLSDSAAFERFSTDIEKIQLIVERKSKYS